MMRSLLFVSAAQLVACLSLNKAVPLEHKPIIFDFASAGLNFTQELLDYEPFTEEELAGLANEVNMTCHSYEEQASGLEPVKFSFRRQDLGIDGAARQNVSLNVSLTRELAAKLKKACFGEAWSAKDCMSVTLEIRVTTWPLLQSSTVAVPSFEHLRHSLQAPPPVKTFRVSGGVKGDVPCRGSQGNAQLYFRHIWKAAGLAVENNLALLSNETPGPPLFVDRAWGVEGFCASYLEGKNSGRVPSPVLFTFVRDPVEKFVAGYKEIASRGLIDDIRGHPVGSLKHAQLFLDNVFHGVCDNGHVLLQVQSMMGAPCESRFDFIGKLEHMEEDWQRLGRHAGCTEELGWPAEWAHKSDLDDKGASTAMREALEENDSALMKSLCLWLLPDYLAFEYAMPDACKELGLRSIA